MKIRWSVIVAALASMIGAIYLLVIGFKGAVAERDLDAVSCGVVSCWIHEWQIVIIIPFIILVVSVIVLIGKWEKISLIRQVKNKTNNKFKNENASKAGTDAAPERRPFKRRY